MLQSMPKASERRTKPIVVRGRLTGPRRIELDKAVTGLSGPVEVALRPATRTRRTRTRPDWFETGRRAIVRWLDENPY